MRTSSTNAQAPRENPSKVFRRQSYTSRLPAASAALVCFGVMLGVNMQAFFMHPPFGFASFFLCGVARQGSSVSDDMQ